MPTQQSKRYVAVVVGLILGGLVWVVLVNLIIDPYDLYRFVRIPGANGQKFVRAPERLRNAYRVWVQKPSVVILGSSRAQAGLDSGDPAWDGSPGRPHNLALGGATMLELNAYFRHAHARGALKQVVIGLDFFSFNVLHYTGEDFDAGRLATSPPLTIGRSALRDVGSTLLSMDALVASAQTVWWNNSAAPPQAPWEVVQVHAGQRAAFRFLERSYMQGTWFPCPMVQFALFSDSADKSGFDYLRDIVRTARRDKIDLRLFISPVHARLREALYEVGLWPEYERWERMLVNIVHEESGTASEDPEVKLWDFNSYNELTIEPVPADGDLTSRMKWFLDSAHYSKAFGHLILEKVLGTDEGDMDGIGVVITRRNIDEHLVRLRAGRAAYAASHARDLWDIADQVERTKDYRRQRWCRRSL